MNSKKALGAVVATALLIVVTVLAVVGFQSWYQTYSSNIFSSSQQNSITNSLEIKGVIGNQVYLKSDGSKLNSIEIFSSNGSRICSLSGSSNSSSINLTSGLVGWWKLDDESATITDYSGNGNDGKLYGNTRLLLDFDDGTATDKTAYENDGTLMNDINCSGEGISGFGCVFDGTDDYINFTTGENFNYDYNDFSISVWIKTNNYSSNNWGDSIISKSNMSHPRTGFDLRFSGDLYTLNSNKIIFWMGLGDYTGYTLIGPVINDSQWKHIVVTVDRDGFMKLYVNSILSHSIDISEFVNINNSNQEDFFIGKNYFAKDSIFNGSIDEVAIYSKALTEDEVQELYHEQNVKFIEFKDSKLDKAVEFDGEDDYIEIPQNLPLDEISIVASAKKISSYRDVDNIHFTLFSIYNSTIDRFYILNHANKNDWATYGRVNATTVASINSPEVYYINSNDFIVSRNSNSLSKSSLSVNNNLMGYNGFRTLTSGYITIGAINNGTDRVAPFNGEIDDIKVYDRFLSDEEISALYLNSISNTQVGLNTINLESCNLNKGEKYEIFVTTNTGAVDKYFIAK